MSKKVPWTLVLLVSCSADGVMSSQFFSVSDTLEGKVLGNFHSVSSEARFITG